MQDENQNQQNAVITIFLVAANVVAFFALSLFGDTEDARFMLEHGAAYAPYILTGEYYRLFTCMFLHFGISHLINNMVMLAALGWNLESEIGKVRLLLIYLLSGLGGNLLSLYMDLRTGEMVVSAGASGAIFGLMGAMLYLVIRNKGKCGRIYGSRVPLMVALSLYFGFASSGVDNAAHVGGLITGFVVSVILCPPIRLSRAELR